MWRDPAVASQISDRNVKGKKPVFEQISKRLKSDHQIQRDRHQVSSKIRDMRRTFNTVLPEGGHYGLVTADNWPYFDTMKEILGEEISVRTGGSDLLHEESVPESTCIIESVPESESICNVKKSAPESTRNVEPVARRCRWSDTETKALLSMWKEPGVSAQIAKRVMHMRKPIFDQLAERLKNEHQIDRDREQVSSKIRDLRKSYHERLLQEGDCARCVDSWPYFDAMHEILNEETTASDLLQDKSVPESTCKVEFAQESSCNKECVVDPSCNKESVLDSASHVESVPESVELTCESVDPEDVTDDE